MTITEPQHYAAFDTDLPDRPAIGPICLDELPMGQEKRVSLFVALGQTEPEWLVLKRHEHGTTITCPDGLAPVVREGALVGLMYVNRELSPTSE